MSKRKASPSKTSSPKKQHSSSEVAIVGNDASFSGIAASEYFGKETTLVGHDSFDQVFAAVAAGKCKFGMVPIENTTSGPIQSVHELLAASKLFIVGEHASRDNACLVGPKDMKLSAVNRVYSHPAVLQHCSQYLKTVSKAAAGNVDHISVSNTAAACEAVTANKDGMAVAIASKVAASKYGLSVLEENVANEVELTTRYIILSTEAAANYSTTGKRKHSLALTHRNESGSLFKMLMPFNFRNINILKLQSRPACVALEMFDDGAKHWEYVHFVDFEPSIQQGATEGLISDLKEFCQSVRDFGCYEKYENKSSDSVGEYQSLWK